MARETVSWIEVTEAFSGQRIDNFLFARLKGVPKSRIYRLLRKGEIRVNKGRARPERRLNTGDKIRIPPIRTRQDNGATPPDGLCKQLLDAILFEDEAIMVLDKPSGMAVHSGSGITFGVIEALQTALPEVPGLSLVHRLDRETSGCLLLCKDRQLLPALNRVLAARDFDKRYLALLRGRWRGKQRSVNVPLSRSAQAGQSSRNTVDDHGKASETLFIPLRRFRDMTLVEAHPLSGRMHQIRAHAAHIGHPIAGDDKYGDRVWNRQLRKQGLRRLFLHAGHLGFIMPEGGREVSVDSPLADELKRFVDQLGD